MDITNLLEQLGVTDISSSNADLEITTPIDGSVIANLTSTSNKETQEIITRSQQAFDVWQFVPAPKRGELVRLFGEELRRIKEPLGQLVTIECGKIIEEGKGEVQEMIDICDFAVGLSRTIGGLTLPSERKDHIMHENWYPLGVIGVISAFNFPVAVWAWNFCISIVCGNSVVWKPSEKTPLTALACQAAFKRVQKQFALGSPDHLLQIAIGGIDNGKILVEDKRVSMVSATGSCRMGAIVAPKVAARFGRCLLELGGNNGVIVTSSADLDIVVPSIVFGAVGTAGQRCTSTRRIFIQQDIFEELIDRLTRAYLAIDEKIGNPLDKQTLVGPLIDNAAFAAMQHSLATANEQGGNVLGGERMLEDIYPDGYYVRPSLITMPSQTDIVSQETFAPILYAMPFDNLDEAIIQHNAVSQGLSSAIFTTDLREAEWFKARSDCGIANVNIGTSGAEIGGAFGGEKETGGGRESGSDSWKAYMRRQTSTTYFGATVPALAQNITFDT